jgi:RimJ/RimL family protein N-acetyltransferase
LRGQGVGEKLIRELLRYSFEELGMNEVELNVYDWNVGAIHCYEKAGFVINPDKVQYTDVDSIHWKALNMTINRKRWEKIGQI